jgi:hypothetical protein
MKRKVKKKVCCFGVVLGVGENLLHRSQLSYIRLNCPTNWMNHTTSVNVAYYPFIPTILCLCHFLYHFLRKIIEAKIILKLIWYYQFYSSPHPLEAFANSPSAQIGKILR